MTVIGTSPMSGANSAAALSSQRSTVPDSTTSATVAAMSAPDHVARWA
jgi:hypothetical protein